MYKGYKGVEIRWTYIENAEETSINNYILRLRWNTSFMRYVLDAEKLPTY